MILNCYHIMATGRRFNRERFTHSRLSAEHDRTIYARSLTPARVIVDEDVAVLAQIERRWGVDGVERFRESGAFVKPTQIQNWVYCARLRQLFGEAVAKTEGFDTNGLYRLPHGRGLMIPIGKGNDMTGFRFMPFSELYRQKG